MDKKLIGGTVNCPNCGGHMKHKLGTHSLICAYCDSETEINIRDENIEELDYDSSAQIILDAESQPVEPLQDTVKALFVACSNCGAACSVVDDITSFACPYCTTPMVVEDAVEETVINPKSLLPFTIDEQGSKSSMKAWCKAQWFAPNKFKNGEITYDNITPVYIPYWTFDMKTHTNYVGQRGDYYYVRVGSGKNRGRECRTRWSSPRNGEHDSAFDDILVVGSKSIPYKFVYKLEPWDLKKLIPFDKRLLLGILTEKYSVDLVSARGVSETRAEDVVRTEIKQRIGGDEQRINEMQVEYSNVTYKHILLPLYLCAYKYKDKLYQSFINARTGEVHGDRPYSGVKIAIAVIIGLLIGYGIYLLARN
ncbi:MAG: hypothetical protein ACK5MG_02280 [Bacteroidales bacterium]